MRPRGDLSMQNRSPNALNRGERNVTMNRFMRYLHYITFITTELEGTVTKGTGDFAFCKYAFTEVLNGKLLFKHNFKLHMRIM